MKSNPHNEATYIACYYSNGTENMGFDHIIHKKQILFKSTWT